MLYELSSVYQNEKGIFKRWFQDEYFDLIVWYREDTHRLTGFQLCYDVPGREHVLTWQDEKGFAHNRIDDGKDAGRDELRYPSTPILVADGLFDAPALEKEFAARGGGIDPEIFSLVMDKIRAYPDI